MAYTLSPRIGFGEFAGQYLVGNLVSMIVAVFVALAVKQATGSAVFTAITVSVTETIIWYVYIAFYYARREKLNQALRHLVNDFGLAEVLDSFMFRPFLMYVMPIVTSSQALGVVLASVAADVIYTGIALNRQRRRTLG